MLSLRPSPLLRQALLADAATSGACSLLMVLGAGFLERLLGLPAALLTYAGWSLFPFAALLGYLATRETLPPVPIWAVIGFNGLWAADSLLLLVAGRVEPTAAGYAFTIGQALVVVMYAEFQYLGLRRSVVVA